MNKIPIYAGITSSTSALGLNKYTLPVLISLHSYRFLRLLPFLHTHLFVSVASQTPPQAQASRSQAPCLGK